MEVEYEPINLMETVTFYEKKQGLFTIISYACEHSRLLNHTKQEREHILNNILNAKTFDERVDVFRNYFGHVLKINKIGRFEGVDIKNNDISMGGYGC